MNQFKISLSVLKKTKAQSGFTLLEVMVVMVIIAIMAAAVGPNLMAALGKAGVTTAKNDIKTITSMLELYKADNHSYPSTDQGLEALVNKPDGDPAAKNWRQYTKKTLMDPWDTPYKYLNPGSHGEIDIYSFGPDLVQGGDDDIGNWDSKN